jgi:hypothetical protein
MSTTDRDAVVGGTAVRGRVTDDYREGYERPQIKETRRFFETSEFWITAAGLAAIAIIYNVADNPSFTLWRAMVLATVVGIAYVVSRGLAKAGSQGQHWERVTTRRDVD